MVSTIPVLPAFMRKQNIGKRMESGRGGQSQEAAGILPNCSRAFWKLEGPRAMLNPENKG